MAKLSNNIEFIKKANIIHNSYYDYSLVSYCRSSVKIKIICPKHGIFEQIPNNHLNGSGCRLCGIETYKSKLFKSKLEFINKANLVHHNKYDYFWAVYVGVNRKIKIICPKHGEFYQLVSSHLRGRGCPKCNGGVNLTQNEFIERAIKIHGNKYNYDLVNYVNSQTKVKIICKKHDIFEQKPTHHLRNHGCLICKQSKGENVIIQYLVNNSIKFISEKKFKGCKGKRNQLRFDFYLPDYNVLIEFDGEQHYLEGYFNKKSLSEIRANDNIKNFFAKSNNYNLLRIKYCDINKINDILDKYEPIFKK